MSAFLVIEWEDREFTFYQMFQDVSKPQGLPEGSEIILAKIEGFEVDLYYVVDVTTNEYYLVEYLEDSRLMVGISDEKVLEEADFLIQLMQEHYPIGEIN